MLRRAFIGPPGRCGRTRIHEAALALRELGVQVEALKVDLATTDGVDMLYEATRGRAVVRSWPTPATAWGTGFWTRSSTPSATSSI
jgi:hypothetical protein